MNTTLQQMAGACKAVLLAVVACAILAGAPAQADLVGYWNFNEGASNVLHNVCGTNHHGAINGSPGWVTGHTGLYGDYALSFDGNGAKYVQIPDAPELHICSSSNRNCTITLWVWDSGSYYGEAWSYGRNLFLQTGNSVWTPQSYLWSDNNANLRLTGPMIPKQGWHFLAWTYDGATERLYLDDTAAPVAAKAVSNQNLTAWGDLHIGRQRDGNYPWNGLLDDLLILDTAASPAELAQIKGGTFPGMPPLPPAPTPGEWLRAEPGGRWSDPANWTNGLIANGSGQIADFSRLNIVTDNTVHLDAPRTIGDMRFGDADTNSAAGWRVDDYGEATHVLTLEPGTPAITVTNLAAGKSVEIRAVIAGEGLRKEGSGTLLLTGANRYTGLVAINGGTLGAEALPPTVSFANGGRLEFRGTAETARLDTSSISAFAIGVTHGNLTVSRNGGNYNTIVKTGTGTLTVANGWWDDGGDLAVYEGTAVLAGVVNAGALFCNVGSIVDVAPGAVVRLGNAAAGQVFNPLAFHMSGGTYNLNGFSGGAVPAMDGVGIVTNSAAGTTAVATLTVTGKKAFGGKIVDGAGKVAISMAGAGGVWTLSGTNTYSGATTIGAGCTLKAGAGTGCSPYSAFAVAGALDIAGFGVRIGGLTGNGTVTNGAAGGAALTVSNEVADATFAGILRDGAGPLGLVKTGSRSLTLTGLSAYSGDTVVRGGTLGLAQARLDDGADVHVSAGGMLDLSFEGGDAIRSLYLDGTRQWAGTWGAPGSDAVNVSAVFFKGPGHLVVLDGPSRKGALLLLR